MLLMITHAHTFAAQAAQHATLEQRGSFARGPSPPLTSECPGVTFVFTGVHGFPKGTIQGAGIFIGPPDGSQGPANADPFLYGTGAFTGAQGTLTGRQLSFTLDDWTLSYSR